MRRVLIIALTILSGAVCVLTVFAWCFSRASKRLEIFPIGNRLTSLELFEGQAAVNLATFPFPLTTTAVQPVCMIYVTPQPTTLKAQPAHRFLGFGFGEPDAERLQQATLSNTGAGTAEYWAQVVDQLSFDVATQSSAQAKMASSPKLLARLQTAKEHALLAKSPPTVRRVVVPLWFLAILFGILPAEQIHRYLFRRRQFAKGLCSQCGYDLRASKDRCPECGTAIATPQTSS